MNEARLVLEDGSCWDGEGFGSYEGTAGEVVFNTSSVGYQEISSDPSYKFQIVVMTSPHIGNYGIAEAVSQSEQLHVSGFVVRDLSPAFHATSEGSLRDYFEKNNIAAISGVDTRAITRKIRAHGTLRGLITSDRNRTVEDLVAEAKALPSMTGLDLVQKVTTLRPYVLEPSEGQRRLRIAVYDFGVKRDIITSLTRRGCEVVVYPASTHADEIINHRFDGVVLSNGPGDPEPVGYAQENIRQLIGKIPILGICLGHQLAGLALGGKTYKLKFGHHGGNHPIRDIRTGRVEITAQNHGFAVDPDSLNQNEIEFTHINLNDDTLEGFRHRTEPVMAVQFHPEGAPGPSDSEHLFDKFFAMIEAAS